MLAILWILIGVVLLALYNSYLLLDNKTGTPENLKIKDRWHFIGATLFLYISLSASYFFGLKYLLFSLSLFYIIFAGIVHKVALNKPFFFVGTTAKTDILFRRLFPHNTELMSMIIKSSILIISMLLLLF
jgi:hypothetical protein